MPSVFVLIMIAVSTLNAGGDATRHVQAATNPTTFSTLAVCNTERDIVMKKLVSDSAPTTIGGVVVQCVEVPLNKDSKD